jgi:hypothetical protein
MTGPAFSTMTAARKMKLVLSLGALLSNVNDDFIKALSSEVFLLESMKKLNQVGQLGSNVNQRKIEVQAQGDAVPSTHHSEDVPKEYPGLPELMNDMKESFSACLLVMDDNFRLYEWIAYHYHVLPLRYLVVAVDPRSQQLPNPVLDVFRQQLNMTIVSWNDSDYTSWEKPLASDAGVVEKTERHQIRQRRFLAKCLRHMHQHNRTWTTLWDTDEYIAFNGYNFTRQDAATNLSATSPHDMSESGSILRYLKEFGEDKGLSMKRILVGSLETPSLMNESHPFDPRRFDTLRYRYRAKPVSKLNGRGKCMLNVQKISSFPLRVTNPHYPVGELCPKTKNVPLLRFPFFVNHFIGSWEAYSFRDDGRRGSEKTYKAHVERSQQSDVYENKMSQWMPAFVENVGEVRARVLLQNAGLDPEYNASFKIDDFKVVNLTW